jgi:hypothetical protein
VPVLKPLLATATILSSLGCLLLAENIWAKPVSAQWAGPTSQSSSYWRSNNPIAGDRVYNTPTSGWSNGYPSYNSPGVARRDRVNGFDRPTVIIIQPAPVYVYPASSCSTSVVGSPIPLPYAQNSQTGLPCR